MAASPSCITPGCSKPSWNGKAGEYCGRSCKNSTAADNARRASKVSKETEAVCSSGHPLTFQAAPCDGCNCDKCKKVVNKGADLYGCRACNYDLCKDCKASLAVPSSLAVSPTDTVAPTAPRIEKLAASEKDYVSVSDQFYKKWQPETWNDDCGPNKYPVPKIRNIYRLNITQDRDDYFAKKKTMTDVSKMPGAGEGNELRRFHGTRLACDFDGTPCTDSTCASCAIMKTGRFKLDLSAASSGTATYGNGLYFTAMSHTAKAYGIDSSLKRAPMSMTDFVSKEAHNAVFVVLCLAGNTEAVEGVPYVKGVAPIGMDPPDPDTYHSRVVNKPNHNDELVIFAEEQALPRYVMTFEGPSDKCDPSEFVQITDELCKRPGCGKRTWNGKPGEFCGRGCKEKGPIGAAEDSD